MGASVLIGACDMPVLIAAPWIKKQSDQVRVELEKSLELGGESKGAKELLSSMGEEAEVRKIARQYEMLAVN